MDTAWTQQHTEGAMRRSRMGGRMGGFTFIELLVAVLIVSIGLLGVAALQMTGLQNNHSANLRSQASLYSYEIIDSIRANRGNAANYDKDFGDLGEPEPGNGNTAAEQDLNDWIANLRDQFPEGEAQIVTGPGDRVRVSIRWLDDRRAEDNGNGEGNGEKQTFTYATEI